jgi:hypothetical protein
VSWPADKSELQCLADEGLSFTEAGARLGVTRNAIAGRAKRLGVSFAVNASAKISKAGSARFARETEEEREVRVERHRRGYWAHAYA